MANNGRSAAKAKVFRGFVTMTPDDTSKSVVKPVMTHFFYMDEADPTRSAVGSDRLARSISDAACIETLKSRQIPTLRKIVIE